MKHVCKAPAFWTKHLYTNIHQLQGNTLRETFFMWVVLASVMRMYQPCPGLAQFEQDTIHHLDHNFSNGNVKSWHYSCSDCSSCIVRQYQNHTKTLR